jgi:hypothetical protein
MDAVIRTMLRALARPIWMWFERRLVARLSLALLVDGESAIAARLARLDEALHAVEGAVRAQDAAIDQRIGVAVSQRIYQPNPILSRPVDPGRYMAYATCTTADFFHPRYAEFCRMIAHPPMFHRKLWEWAFIFHHLQEAGVLAEGKRGLGFGVGRERLPALFSHFGAAIVATDAPEAIGIASGWSETGQHSNGLDQLRYPEIVADSVFDRNVSHRICDMTAIDPSLTGFDFTWSSCCFEHLGTLEAGLNFVVDSVETTLKPGGIACHTTEFNLVSDDETLDQGETVLYRRQDIAALVERLRARGHAVQPLVIGPDSHVLDHFVDIPPYSHSPHLKLKIGAFVTTSVGIVVRKGGVP